MCPCYSRRTHYPLIQKPSAQNIAACENQGEQRELSDNWKLIKTFFLIKKNITGWHIKDKKIDWNTSFNKRVFILQNISFCSRFKGAFNYYFITKWPKFRLPPPPPTSLSSLVCTCLILVTPSSHGCSKVYMASPTPTPHTHTQRKIFWFAIL